jgi:pimeloyl-ACP methyl ester carboxylesterase
LTIVAAVPTVGVDGTRFYYEERGKGPALVIVPTTGADTSMAAAAARLLETSHRVITYDRRGFGRTSAIPPPRRTYLRKHGDDLATLARELGAVPVTLVGWGWGSLVALATAIHHPALVRELVLYEPPLHARSPFRATALGKVGFEKRAAKRFFESTIGSKTWKTLDARIKSELLSNPKAVVAELAAGNGEELTPDMLGRVKVPVGIVLDAKSAPTPLVRMYPRARVVRMDDPSPMAVVRRPDVFVDTVREAMNRPSENATGAVNAERPRTDNA